MSHIYLVYQLVDPLTSLPYYIGFAKNHNRPYSHLKEYKRWINGRTLKHPNYFKLARIRDIIASGQQYIAEVIFSFTTSDEAYDKEVELIANYGRIDLGTGILTNMSAGGKGFIDPSPEMREKLRNANSKPLKDRMSADAFAKWQQIMSDKLSNPDYIKFLRMAGKKGAKHVIDNGWSKEAIAKRVQTRKDTSGYSTDMSACHTDAAIAQRVITRLSTSGFSTDTSACHTDEARFKREKTKILSVIVRIQTHYQEPFTLLLLKKARRDKVTYLQESSVRKYLTEEEITRYSVCDP